ncbi:MAG: glycosyl hydrolase family 5 [Hyphomicrobiales bacterium]|nr:MAG: glycosyl hydrolase family 5 [Hyphomicrobiales bacterium]
MNNKTPARLALSIILGLLTYIQPAVAEKIENPVSVFAGLDKVSGRVTQFDVYIDETVQFGSLQLTPRVCYSRPETEKQKMTGFIEVDELTLNNKVRRIFNGWMFASSPGLNAVEHPVYDIWLIECKQTSDVPPPAQ